MSLNSIQSRQCSRDMRGKATARVGPDPSKVALLAVKGVEGEGAER
jgi:hypothetical protein